MDYLVVGLNHKTAPIELREKLAFSEDGLDGALKELVSSDSIDEGIILSTCNRVEIYAASRKINDGIKNIKNFISLKSQVNLEEIEPHLYRYEALDAVKHGFRVASSLDSMVIGENQIVGQVKKAYELAFALQTTGVYLNQLMHRALYVSKKIRSETEISKRAVSVGSTSIELAKKIFGDLSQKKVALIGAGKIGKLVITYLKEEGVHEVKILNRTHQKAINSAAEGLGKACPMELLGDVLQEVDVVITAMEGQSEHFTHTKISEIMHGRKNNPIFFIDLGVPRNIDPEVNNVRNVYLYNIDDLQQVVDSNFAFRQAEAKKAEQIVEKEASKFYDSVIRRHPTIAALGKKWEHIRKTELEKTLTNLSHLSQTDQETVGKLTRAIVSRLLHDPIVLLKTHDDDERDWRAHDLLKKLFQLDDE